MLDLSKEVLKMPLLYEHAVCPLIPKRSHWLPDRLTPSPTIA
ncbi:hypothetical protein ACKFKF_27265 [Phormidesmis sp. 146-12]